MTPVFRLGLQIPSFTYPGVTNDRLFETVSQIATTAESSGFDAVFVMDHLFQLPFIGPPDDAMFESSVILSAISARTSRVRLGAMVTGVTYRNPAFLAKVITSLDVVSNGRAILGIGAAWHDVEHEAYGFPFPPPGERLDRLEEAVQICRLMFTQERPSFDGRYYRIHEALNSPRPVSSGGPPILIGGGGERRTLQLVARYADASNIFGAPVEVRRKLGILERHCTDAGRDPAEITKTRLGTLVIGATSEEAARIGKQMRAGRGLGEEDYALRALEGDPDTVAEKARELLDAGLDGLVFNMPNAESLEHVSLAGRTLSKLFA
jgi:F420-dependent oxidoreductase-like protein